jgi:hypothetical protein
MKNATIMLGLSVVLSLGAAAGSSAPLVTPSLSITAPSSVKSGQDIRVDIVITNGSKQPMQLGVVNGEGNAEFNYDINVTRQYNQQVERTNYGLSVAGTGTQAVRFSMRLINLPSGQSYADYFTLNEVYDVSIPGVYVVQVQQQPVAGRATAQSNTIKIVVR